jgi:hypothetical protein
MDAAAMHGLPKSQVDVDIVHRRKTREVFHFSRACVRRAALNQDVDRWTPSSAEEATSRSPWHSRSEQSVWSMDA